MMKNTILVGTALVGMLFMGQAFGAGLTGAQIAGTYNADTSNIFGSDFLETFAGPNNVTGLASLEHIEFITGDSVFQIDFNAAGLVTFYVDGATNVPASAFTFDFGSSLGSMISGFSAVDTSAIVGGSPTLSVVNSHKISANLGTVVGNSTSYSFTSQLAFTSPVPEPIAPAMLIAGLGVLALSRRASKK